MQRVANADHPLGIFVVPSKSNPFSYFPIARFGCLLAPNARFGRLAGQFQDTCRRCRVLQAMWRRAYRPTTKCIAVSVETCSFTL
jgi:hypothetical protein